MLGQGEREEEYSQAFPLALGARSWAGQAQLCNHTAVIRTSCPGSSPGCGEKGSVHTGKIPDPVVLKGIFLLAWEEQGMGEPQSRSCLSPSPHLGCDKWCWLCRESKEKM